MVMADMMGQPAAPPTTEFLRHPPQDCCPALMFTSQLMPNRSTHWPKMSPQGALSSGTVMVPPSDSLSQ